MEAFKLVIVLSVLTISFASDDEESMQTNFFDEETSEPISTTYRLPNDTRPTLYTLFIKTDVDQKDFNFTGMVKINIKALQRTSVVTLHCKKLIIEKAILADKDGDVENEITLQVEYFRPKDFLLVKLPRDMEPHENFVLELYFRGILARDQTGFYRAFFQYKDQFSRRGRVDKEKEKELEIERDRVYYAVTQFQPTSARKAFPCYDEPGIKTIFAVQVQHSKRYRAFSNTELVSETPVEGTDHVISRFRSTPVMQTHNVAFVVAPFDELSNNDRRVPQRIIARPAAMKYGEANFGVKQVGPLLKKMEELFGIKLPLTKLDHVAVDPAGAGAMANWGISVYHEYNLLIKRNQSARNTLAAQKSTIQIIAHEHAHQFFGNIIAPHWWTDVWLNEGFATLFEYYVPHVMFPDYGYMDSFRKSELEEIFELDVPLNEDSLPMSNYVESPYEIESNFNAITLAKAASVLRMFQVAYGTETFRRGVEIYFQRRLYLVAEPKDLFASFQQSVDEHIPLLQHNVEKQMSTWVYQAGYPIVSVSVEGKDLVLEQFRFPKPKSDEVYSIPLSFATKSNPNFNITHIGLWLHTKELRVPLSFLHATPKDWIIFNVQQTGVYRVYYSQKMWQLIADGLRTNINAVHPINREVLMAELRITFFDFDEMLISGVFEIMMFLVNEEQFSVWDEIEKIITQIQFNFVGTESYDNYLKFLQYITRKQMKRIGFEAKPDEPLNDALLRPVLIEYNCFALDPLCNDHQTKELELLLLQGNNDKDINFCAALSKASQNIFQLVINFVVKEKESPELRAFNLLGLTCTRDRLKLQQLIRIIENRTNELTEEDRVLAISKMFLTSNEAQTVAMEYFIKYPRLLRSQQFRQALMESMNTVKYAEQAKEIIKTSFYADIITMQQAIELYDGISARTYWHGNNYQYAVAWFKKNDKLLNERNK